MTARFPAPFDDLGAELVSPRAIVFAGPPLPQRTPPTTQRPPSSDPSASRSDRAHAAEPQRLDNVGRRLKDYQIGILIARRVIDEARRSAASPSP